MLFLLSNAVFAQVLTMGGCSRDSDCQVHTQRLQADEYSTRDMGGYVCIQGQCKYAVGTNSLCVAAENCAAFTLIQNAVASNQTLSFDPQSYISQLCDSKWCTIASDCSTVSKPFFGADFEAQKPTAKCCGPIPVNNFCESIDIKTCGTGEVCLPDAAPKTTHICAPLPQKDTQWVGILLTIAGATLANTGLNVQKYAHRKRFEKKVRGIQERQLSFRHRFQQSITNFYRTNISRTNFNSNPTIAVPTELPLDPEITEDPMETEPTVVEMATNNVDVIMPSLDIPPTTATGLVVKDRAEFHNKKIGLRHLLIDPRWVLGIILYAFGNISNVVALNFAAQSLLAPLTSVQLVSNVIMAPLINGESWNFYDLVGVALIIGGSTILVVFAGFPPKDYTICVLLKLFRAPATVVYLSVTMLLIIFHFVFIIVVEKNLIIQDPLQLVDDKSESSPDEDHEEETKSESNGEKSLRDELPKPKLPGILSKKIGWHKRTLDKLTSYPALRWLSIFRVPTLKNKINVGDPIARYGLPLAYAAVGGLMGTISILCAKATSHLIEATLAGENQFNDVSSYILTILTVVTALGQVYWLNVGLAKYDAMIQVPVSFVTWTTFDVIGGGIYFDEFSGFSAIQFILFVAGLVIIYVGVTVLTARLKESDTEE